MSNQPDPEPFSRYFGFLESDYDFQIRHTADQFGDLYVAESDVCTLRIGIKRDSSDSGLVTIQASGAARQALVEKGVRGRALTVAGIARCYESDLAPEWWQGTIPQIPLSRQAEYVKKYCRKMLAGDFSEWGFLERRLAELAEERAKEFRKQYEERGYQVEEQNGKYGLSYHRIPVLAPVYSCVEVINDDSKEYSLENYKDDPAVIEVGEYNFPIVIADGKYGLLLGSELRLGLDYTRIIKLTFCHYLFQTRDGAFVLYDVDNLMQPLAAFAISGELTLEKLLKTLENGYPAAYAELGKRLRRQGDRYVSEYRRYDGTQAISSSMFHDFHIATVEVILNSDFSVSPV
ncbi:MAG: hypothetical protein ACOYYJ_21575 [Chloroflexota bacterium]